MAEQIQQAHALYCELTGQKLRLAYDRERAWYELLHAGFTLEDVRAVASGHPLSAKGDSP